MPSLVGSEMCIRDRFRLELQLLQADNSTPIGLGRVYLLILQCYLTLQCFLPISNVQYPQPNFFSNLNEIIKSIIDQLMKIPDRCDEQKSLLWLITNHQYCLKKNNEFNRRQKSCQKMWRHIMWYCSDQQVQ
eukprot:TRINITY_DN17922_c0_g1_i1.p1 TRINITY_DN17922_c0_g1~~TRINITY_DN17922_c0_g1_i1.p1  ORF type:complete len:132 (+),score=5.71 TRINITY_DN17922_c0_g1_i1:116-511(+)